MYCGQPSYYYYYHHYYCLGQWQMSDSQFLERRWVTFPHDLTSGSGSPLMFSYNIPYFLSDDITYHFLSTRLLYGGSSLGAPPARYRREQKGTLALSAQNAFNLLPFHLCIGVTSTLDEADREAELVFVN